MRLKISQFVVIAVSIFLLLVGGTAWVGAERLGAKHEITLAKLEKTDSTQWVAALDAVHRPLAESSVATLLTMTTTLGKALWVIKSLGACLTVSALCLLVLGCSHDVRSTMLIWRREVSSSKELTSPQ